MKIVADENIPHVAECFAPLGEVTVLSGRQITRAAVGKADMLLVRSVTQVTEDLLSASRVRFVATATIGFEHVDVEYLAKRNIGFASAPGSNANSVAEYIVAALLSVGRKSGIELEGKSIGVVGAGNVGSRVEKKAKALKMKAYLNDPPLQRQTGDPKYVPLEQLYGCDIITLHTPLTFEGIDKTYHLADERFFKSLREGCVFMNTARGGVVDSSALKGAIKAGRLGGVVLDVWENEPRIDVELLRKVDIGTPHIAGYSLDGKIAGTVMIYEAACEYFGVKVKKKAEDFLPGPQVPEIRIDDSGGDEQNVLHETVQQVYAINRDDFNMRELAMVQPEIQGKFFDDLRKNYPVRREFHNTTVLIKDAGIGLAKKLAGIGFSVRQG